MKLSVVLGFCTKCSLEHTKFRYVNAMNCMAVHRRDSQKCSAYESDISFIGHILNTTMADKIQLGHPDIFYKELHTI